MSHANRTTGSSYAEHLARYRMQFAAHELVEHASAPDGSLRSFYLRGPDRTRGRRGSVYLLFTVEGIIITGDLSPTDNTGCGSSIGYGLEWFTSPLREDILCRTFLRRQWVPEIGERQVRRALLEHRRAGAIESTHARALYAEIGWFAGELRSSDAWRIYHEAGLEDFGDLGWDFVPRDAALLVAIQERFAACYIEITADELLRKSA